LRYQWCAETEPLIRLTNLTSRALLRTQIATSAAHAQGEAQPNFTFTRHPVKIGTITKKNESVHILAGKTRCCGFSVHNGGQSKIAELRLLTNEPG